MAQASSPAVRSFNVDVVRVVGMVMVVILHTILNFTLRTDFFATKLWFLFEPLVSLSKTSVLLFFALSGYLILNKQRTISQNTQKIVLRLFVPLLSFTALDAWYMYGRYTGPSLLDFLNSQILRLIGFPSSALWFLWVLIACYLLNPLLQNIFANSKNQRIAIYLQVLTFLFAIVTNIVMFSTPLTLSFFNVFTGWLAYLGFYIYGGNVKNGWINARQPILNAALVLGGLVLAIIGDYYVGLTGIRTTHLINFLTIPVIMMTVGLFNFLITTDFSFLQRSNLGKFSAKIIEELAGLSFGVYLIHTFVITYLRDRYNFDFNVMEINVYLYNLLNLTLVLGISLVLTYFIKKIPLINMIIGGKK